MRSLIINFVKYHCPNTSLYLIPWSPFLHGMRSIFFIAIGVMVSFFKFLLGCGKTLGSRGNIWRLGNRQEVIEDRRKNSIRFLWRFVSWVFLQLIICVLFLAYCLSFFLLLIGLISCFILRYHGVYLGQDVAVKVLRSEQLNDASEDEFAQEVAILRSVFCHSLRSTLHIA